MNMKTITNSSLAKLNPYSAEGKAIQRLPLEADDSQWITTIERVEEIVRKAGDDRRRFGHEIEARGVILDKRGGGGDGVSDP